MGDKVQRHERKYKDVREGTKDVLTGTGEGDREIGDRGKRGKTLKCTWCAEMILAHAQPARASKIFLHMLSIRGNQYFQYFNTFLACAPLIQNV